MGGLGWMQWRRGLQWNELNDQSINRTPHSGPSHFRKSDLFVYFILVGSPDRAHATADQHTDWQAGDGRRWQEALCDDSSSREGDRREAEGDPKVVVGCAVQEMDQSRMSSVSKERKRDQRKRQNTFCFKSE